MQHEVTFAGFGGQGIMVAGKMLAYAGMQHGLEVVWIPSYGPEMRGGTAYCNVVLSDQPIGSPVISTPDHAIVMNRPSLDKFGPCVRPGGVLIVNSSLVDARASREDIDQCHVAANDLAIAAGNPRSANMVILGAYIGRTGVLPVELLHAVIKDNFSGKPKVIDINLKAFTSGLEQAQTTRPKGA